MDLWALMEADCPTCALGMYLSGPKCEGWQKASVLRDVDSDLEAAQFQMRIVRVLDVTKTDGTRWEVVEKAIFSHGLDFVEIA
jgi:hypothetical protein